MLLFAIAVSYASKKAGWAITCGPSRMIRTAPGVWGSYSTIQLIAFSISAVLDLHMRHVLRPVRPVHHPSSTMDLMMSIQLCIIVLIGGIGKLFGPVVGAFVFIPLTELTRVYLGSEGQGIDMIIYSLLIIVLAIAGRRGFGPCLKKVSDERYDSGGG